MVNLIKFSFFFEIHLELKYIIENLFFLASDGSGFRVVKVEKNELKHKYYAFEDCPKKLDF